MHDGQQLRSLQRAGKMQLQQAAEDAADAAEATDQQPGQREVQVRHA